MTLLQIKLQGGVNPFNGLFIFYQVRAGLLDPKESR